MTPTLTGVGEKHHLSTPQIDLETHIQDVVKVIEESDLEEVILVGHSYGGMVITGVADRIPNKIESLIYLAAVLPLNNESMFDAVGPEIASYLYERAQEGNGWEVPPGKPEGYGIASKDLEWFNNMTSPHPLKSFQQKLQYMPNTINKVYISCTQDEGLKVMANRAQQFNMEYKEINSGHCPMITCPDDVVEAMTL